MNQPFPPAPTGFLSPQERSVWAVACDTLCQGWSIGISEEDGISYADVYLTCTEAEQELADIIHERLNQFIEDPESYGDLDTALDCGFEVVMATVNPDGTVLIDGEDKGKAAPAIRQALDHAAQQTNPA